MTPLRVALGLDGPAGDGSFVDAGIAAVRRVRDRGIDVEIVPHPSLDQECRWDVAVAHGSALGPWAVHLADHGCRVALCDLPETQRHDLPLHYVDWSWDQGLAEVARRVIDSGARHLVLIAGPSFPPQERIVAAVTAQVNKAHGVRLDVVRTTSFADLSHVASVAATVTNIAAGVAHVMTSAGPLGEAVCQQLRAVGYATSGISSKETGHTLRVVSDVTAVVAELLEHLVEQRPLPSVVSCEAGGPWLRVAGDL